ncbi:MAG: glycosyltransferase family 4 protein [Gelidibacter sp.]
MKQKKILFILHLSPPIHGAAKVGDTILKSKKINQEFDARYIKIKSSITLSEINKFKVLKLYFFAELFFKVIYQLIMFRPQLIYYTASPCGLAFYRDLIVSLPLRFYKFLNKSHIFFHYHLEGINSFATASKFNSRLTNFFIKDTNLIFISKAMVGELEKIKNYRKVFYVHNGIEDTPINEDFNSIWEDKLKSNTINVLYLSSMIKDKGYHHVLNLAKNVQQRGREDIKFNFAGAYFSDSDRTYFDNFVIKNKLKDTVEYLGFINGADKTKLFNNSHLLIFPSKKDVFPLTILEALSYGIPILTFDAGAITEIVSTKIGLISNKESLENDFDKFTEEYLNFKACSACRNAFLDNYTNEIFEKNLIDILNKG